MTKDLSAPLSRTTAILDSYIGLRRLGYTRLGAIRALRTLGVPFAEARQADITFSAPSFFAEDRVMIEPAPLDDEEQDETRSTWSCGDCEWTGPAPDSEKCPTCGGALWLESDEEDEALPVGECPSCHEVTGLSDAPEGAVSFPEPLCDACRSRAVQDLALTPFDEAYERARANGWED